MCPAVFAHAHACLNKGLTNFFIERKCSVSALFCPSLGYSPEGCMIVVSAVFGGTLMSPWKNSMPCGVMPTVFDCCFYNLQYNVGTFPN